MNEPAVSVVMSVYDGERHVGEAIESVLAQTYDDFEYIIVDDGSSDRTHKILEGYSERDSRIVIITNERNLGLTRSLNRALGETRGTYVARQDADDVCLPERFGRQVAYLEGQREVGVVGSAYEVLDEEGGVQTVHLQPLTDTEIRWQMLFHNAFCHTSVMFRRDIFDDERFQVYDEKLRYSQDYDLWARAMRRTRGANLGEPLVGFRVRGTSVSGTRFSEQQAAATRIAARQVNELVPFLCVSDGEMATLREWYYHFPRRLTRGDLRLCQSLWDLVAAFCGQPGLERRVCRRLRRSWMDRILGTLSLREVGLLFRSGLLQSMFREDALSALTHLPRRLVRESIHAARAS